MAASAISYDWSYCFSSDENPQDLHNYKPLECSAHWRQHLNLLWILLLQFMTAKVCLEVILHLFKTYTVLVFIKDSKRYIYIM